MKDFAIKLYNMQAKENDGRGISCVRNIVTYLHLKRIDAAKQIFSIDGDKIRQYPEIYQYIEQNLGCRLHGTIDCERCHGGYHGRNDSRIC